MADEKKDKKLEVNIDEQVKTPDEVIEHIAREYTPALDRLLTPEGRQQYFVSDHDVPSLSAFRPAHY
jgi:hypothetical protein